MRYAIFLAFLAVLSISGALTTSSLAQDTDQAPASSTSLPAGYPTSVAEAIATSNDVLRSSAILIDHMQDLMNANIGATPAYLNAIGITKQRAETLLDGCKHFLATATGGDAAALRNNISVAEKMLNELDRMTQKLAERGTLI